MAASFPRDRGWQPAALTPQYKTSVARSPNRALLSMPQTLSETTGPVFGHNIIGPLDHDMTVNYAAEGESAIGPRIIVSWPGAGRDPAAASRACWSRSGRPMRAGSYRHAKEGYIAPLDPNFGGCGRVITGRGRMPMNSARCSPAPIPGRTARTTGARRISTSRSSGPGFAQRLITQMYFEGDPLIPLCPIVDVIPHQDGIDSLVAALDMNNTIPMDARAYKFDLVLRGRRSTMFENRLEGN